MSKVRRGWRFRLFVFAIIGVASIGLAEFLLAAIGISFPRPYIPDEQIGTRLQPGFNAWFGKEGGAYVRVNSMGFRDSEHSNEKPAAELRIAVLGDSYVEAMQVGWRETFWKQLELQLQDEDSDRHVSCRGYGISGFGTAQELLTFRHYVKPMEPDVVVLAMTLANDIRNNSRSLEPVKERPFFKLRDQVLVEDRSFLKHPAFLQAQQSSTQWKTSIINSSRLMQLAAELKNQRLAPVDVHQAERGLEDTIYQAPTDDAWIAAWLITEALIVQLHQEVAAANARLFVVTLTDGVQVTPDQATYDEFCEQIGEEDLTYGDRRIEQLCNLHDIPVLNLAKPMRVKAVAESTYFHGFHNTQPGTGHWNVAGHHAAGELIAEFLRQRELTLRPKAKR